MYCVIQGITNTRSWPPDANELLKENTTSNVEYFQAVNEPPTELSAMFIVLLRRIQYFTSIIGLEDVDCVFDQACNA